MGTDNLFNFNYSDSALHRDSWYEKLDKIFGSLLGIVYYQFLMQNIAKGKEPKATKNSWPSLIQAVYNQGLAVLFPQRAK